MMFANQVILMDGIYIRFGVVGMVARLWFCYSSSVVRFVFKPLVCN